MANAKQKMSMTDQFIGQTLAGKYRVDSFLRQSGLGKMYRGTHLLMDKPVCIKILSPALAVDENIVKDFSVEARTLSRIAHPNILNVTDFGSDVNGTVYIILEGASGETLKETVKSEGKFSLNRAVRIAWQIASALSAAHAEGVIHHHLTAENVLLAKTAGDAETVKILDFGSAKSNGEPDLKDLEYLSPEQNASVSEADERSDVYSLGVIFYEMLAGEVPFRADDATALITKQAENPPPPFSAYRSDLPQDVEFVVLKALAKVPEMRYQTANEFADALNRASNNAGGAETVLITDAPDNSKNNLWKTAFVVLAGISLLAVAMIYATSVKQTNVPTQLQTDANGQPVQPLNPATGINEQSLTSMMPNQQPAMMGGNSNIAMPQPMPNGDGYGDGYNAWAHGGQPPPGAPPQYVAPGGQMVTIPGAGSQFMPNDTGGYILVPANTNTNPQPSPTPKGGKTPPPAANTAQPTPTPNAQTQPMNVKPTPAPKTEKTPAAKPTATPKTVATPASKGKNTPSGKEQDS
ncbi:MAG: protein kinase [Acidobacteriota bacterium]|nr:protein kinase [Acidobacteriota bacterium]